jgi:hypothetical protein
MALVRDLQVLDEDLPETGHDSSVDVIVSYPGHAVWPATKAARPVPGPPLPAKISAIPALMNHLAQPEDSPTSRESLTRNPDASSPASAHPHAHSC